MKVLLVVLLPRWQRACCLGMGTKPSAEVINCQRVHATESGEISGPDAGKKVKRHKGQILTNTNGFLVGAAIHCAGMHSPMRRLALLISAYNAVKIPVLAEKICYNLRRRDGDYQIHP